MGDGLTPQPGKASCWVILFPMLSMTYQQKILNMLKVDILVVLPGKCRCFSGLLCILLDICICILTQCIYVATFVDVVVVFVLKMTRSKGILVWNECRTCLD